MYLKKLELQGFKSFPEHTLIEFDQGMTAVVGPNGSGKSNVTDAIRWVLGEQSVRSLRGGKMEDVIFNGTQSRKAMNYAEVSLTLDNSDRSLDIEYSEIQITRRLYRSGESEYQINHVNCRLKDIVRLFLDTGLGKDGYSIVGQGRVDEILSTKSEDRRRVIEEASGIVKYKVRKEEAERKLNSTNQNLIRIDDSIASLEERVGPLKEQAEKAVAYHKAYDELKEKDIGLLIRKIDDANSSMGDSASVKEQLEEDIKTQEDRYMSLRNSNTELTSKSDLMEQQIEDKRQEMSDISEKMHDIGADNKVNEERIKQLRSQITDSEEEEQRINDKIKSLRSDNDARTKKADELLSEANEENKKTEKLILERDALQSEIDKSQKKESSIRKNIDNKTSELIDTRDRINKTATSITTLDEKIKELGDSLQNALKAKEELEGNLGNADKTWREMMEREAEVTSDITERTDKLSEHMKQEKKLLSRYEELNRTFLSENGRLKSLKDLEARKEGYQESVRRLTEHIKRDPSLSRGVVGIVGDLITTDKEYRTAIEIALGNSIHNVVTDKESDAARLIDELKKNKLGRVTFLPIENIEPRAIEDKYISKAEGKVGYIGIASELVKTQKKVEDIVENLLGRIIVCEDLDSARSIASVCDHKFKVITLSGDSVNPGGSLTGGSIRKDSVGILGRSKEIAELAADIEKTEQELSVIEAQRQVLDEETGDIKKELELLEEQLKCFGIERVKAETEYKNLNTRISEIEDSINETKKSMKEVSAEKIRNEDDLEELKLIAEETEGELQDFKDDIVKNDSDSKDVVQRLDQMREKITEGQMKAQRIISERNAIMEVSSHVKGEIGNLEGELKLVLENREENKKAVSEVEAEILKTSEEYKNLQDSFNSLGEQIKIMNARKDEIDKELSGFFTKMDDINETLNGLRQKHNNLITKYERFINDIDMSKNRLWEDYETTYDNVCGKYPKITNIGETVKQISALKAKIKELGPVNLNSVDEYKEVSERYEFMLSQRNDIVDAKTNLEKVIADLITEMKEQFITQFNTINENFKTVFTDLFNGGSAEIMLENEEDVLNCAIEIKAQPPGKKLQNLTLLSGGERCLTAIALLFAILQLRPSPFVVLDEVEAALDDVNVTRFTDFVRRYTAKSQFILVTHRKGTMEACDRMYGVTMQERGISKILSMRIQ